MNPTYFTHYLERGFSTLLRPKSYRAIRLIFIWALACDLVIIPAVFIKIYYFPRLVPFVVTANAEAVLGPATINLVEKLKTDSLDPIMLGRIHRRQFAVAGKMISVGGNDNIQVFEYSDHTGAMSDVSTLIERYAISNRPLPWKEQMHVYVDGSLVIFYVGGKAQVLDSLSRNAGVALHEKEVTLAKK